MRHLELELFMGRENGKKRIWMEARQEDGRGRDRAKRIWTIRTSGKACISQLRI